MKVDIYRNTLSDLLQRNEWRLIRRNFIVEQDNHPKHTDAQHRTIGGEVCVCVHGTS